MPGKVKNVRWKCKRCGKQRWYKPYVANSKHYCSRECQYEAQKVANPVRVKRANVVVRYGNRNCEKCGKEYEAKTKSQKFCSQVCATQAIHDRRRSDPIKPKPCEHCGKKFTPRQGSAGRFCSKTCSDREQQGAKSSAWKGGKHLTAEGYVKVSVHGHPQAHGHGDYVSEHRLVMEKHLGRYLESHETVHHKNNDRSDNRIENLQLRSGRHGKGVNAKCGDCGSSNIIFIDI